MRSHNRKIDGGRLEFLCDRGNCGKTFQSPSDLKKHQNIHDNILETCYFCPWGVPVGQTTNIATHLDKHLNHASFKCLVCGKSFFRKIYLQHHFEIHHEKIEGKYKCSFCPYRTHSKDCFNHHRLRFHKTV